MPDNLKSYLKKLNLIKYIREFFVENGFEEVYTPCITEGSDISPSIRAFQVEPGLFLITSPEFDMKKLVSMGMKRIFQITHFFRRGEFLSTHNPEFIGLEWYEAGKDYVYAMDLTENLIQYISEKMLGKKLPRFERKSVEELLEEEGLERNALFDRELFQRSLKERGINLPQEPTLEELFNIFISHIEKKLGKGKPLILYDFPSYLPSLAREKGPFSERFELFINGVEVGNAYTEITEPEVNKSVVLNSRKEFIERGIQFGIDWDFLSIELPSPTTGMAMGVERLLMGLLNEHSIEAILLPLERERFRKKDLKKILCEGLCPMWHPSQTYPECNGYKLFKKNRELGYFLSAISDYISPKSPDPLLDRKARQLICEDCPLEMECKSKKPEGQCGGYRALYGILKHGFCTLRKA